MTGSVAHPDSKGNYGRLDGDWLDEVHAAQMRFGMLTDGLVFDEQSAFQHVQVYNTPFLGKVMTIDGLVMFTERDEFVYHEMLTHVPLLAMKNPTDVLIIGGGDCGCLREVLKHSCVQRVVQCDIDETVTRAAEAHFPWVQAARADDRATLIFEDGIQYIKKHTQAFDLIVVDSTDPVGPAEGLFNADFYASVAHALKEGGIMTAQTESPHWDARLMRDIYQTIRKYFATTRPYLGMIPTYPSGSWSWCFASNAPEKSAEIVDLDRATAIAPSCHYYTPALSRAAFALPQFVQRIVDGQDPFARFGGQG